MADITPFPDNAKKPKSEVQIHKLLSSGFKNILRHYQNEVKKLTRVKTGHLRDSITWEVLIDELNHFQGVVGTNTDYARPQEFGAQPHRRNKYDQYGIIIGSFIHPGFEGAFMFHRGLEMAEKGMTRIITRAITNALMWE